MKNKINFIPPLIKVGIYCFTIVFNCTCNFEENLTDNHDNSIEEPYDVETDNDQIGYVRSNNLDSVILFPNMDSFLSYYKSEVDFLEGQQLQLLFAFDNLRKETILEFGSQPDFSDTTVLNWLNTKTIQIYGDVGFELPESINFQSVFNGQANLGPADDPYFTPPSFYEHKFFTGAELDFPSQPNLDVTELPSPVCEDENDYVVSLADLSLSPKSSGGHWEDKISSFGADYHPSYKFSIFYFEIRIFVLVPVEYFILTLRMISGLMMLMKLTFCWADPILC